MDLASAKALGAGLAVIALSGVGVGIGKINGSTDDDGSGLLARQAA